METASMIMLIGFAGVVLCGLGLLILSKTKPKNEEKLLTILEFFVLAFASTFIVGLVTSFLP